jgi:type IV secretory pathway TraG/TraD family ATPase VirD4
MDSMVYIYILIAIFALITVAVVFFVNWREKKIQITASLNLVLFEISLPYKKSENTELNFKESISAMEQFYAGMSALENYFVLEVGLPFSGEEVVFYSAVPKDKAQLFEKQAQGIFPNAKVNLQSGDYNIFKPDGVSVGSILKLKRNAVLPIKTYDKFESDPLQVIINAFSKLQKEGEGASLQIVVDASGGKDAVTKKAKSVIAKLREGKSFAEAIESNTNIFSATVDIVNEVFFTSGDKNKKEESPLPPKPIDETLIKLLESKASSRELKANIRLLASGENKEKAKSILSELESVFLQFGETQGNEFYFVRPTGSRLKKLFYYFTFRIMDKNALIPLNVAELATVFHFPAELTSASAPTVKYLKTKEMAPPINLPQEGTLLGQNTYRGNVENIYIKGEDRMRHLYVIGQTGTGKSTLLKNMIVQDMEEGKGVCFIDPHGSDLEEIISRIPQNRVEDVVYFNPGDIENPMGLNMLEYDIEHPEQKTFIVNELLGIFNKLFDMKTAGGPMFEQYFRNATLLVMEDPESGNTLFEVSRVLTDKTFRDYKLSKTTNPIVTAFWRDVAEKAGGEGALQNMVPYITSKFDTFLSNDIMRPVISQQKSAFNFRDIMDKQKILLVNLSKGRLGDINSNLLGLIIVGKLLMASLSRVDILEEERKDFFLYIDEFQNVTTDSIATILSEARKYRLGLIIAHQFIGQVEENIKKAVFGNVGSMAVFRTGAEDAEFLAKYFEPVFEASDIANMDNYIAFLKMLVDGHVTRPFNIQAFKFEKGNIGVADEIKKLSAIKYGRPRAEVEAEIAKKYEK